MGQQHKYRPHQDIIPQPRTFVGRRDLYRDSGSGAKPAIMYSSKKRDGSEANDAILGPSQLRRCRSFDSWSESILHDTVLADTASDTAHIPAFRLLFVPHISPLRTTRSARLSICSVDQVAFQVKALRLPLAIEITYTLEAYRTVCG